MLRTALLVDPAYLAHGNPAGHPEQVARMETLLTLGDRPGRPGIVPVRPRPATESEITAAHTSALFESVAASAGRDLTIFDADTSAGPASFDTARLAAGGFLEVIDSVVSGAADNGFALVRPPGHHAESDKVMGFCFFNNVAIGAEYLRRRHGLERVLILDWDVHHGNGTQDIFYRDPNVLFVSLHEYPLYPGTGAAGERGEGAGHGATLNVPLAPGGGDDVYRAAMEELVAPAVREFAPEFVLVSAGFDAHHADPLANMRVTTEGFADLARITMELAADCCGGRIAAVLEGGYDLAALRSSVVAVLEQLGGEAKR